MKRYVIWSVPVVLVILATSVLSADVKTREKSSLKIEGMIGRLMGMMGASGDSAATVAVKGDRLSRMDAGSGQIVDLAGEKIYLVDLKKKEYRVMTFAEMREQWKKAQAEAEKQRAQMKPEDKQQIEDAGKQLELTADVKETGQRKTIAGHDAREVIVSITGHEKGKKVEESGGFILTTTSWLGPKVPALDEIAQFQLKFVKAVYGDAFLADMQQMMGALTMFPSLKPMMERLQAENRKLQGTPLMSTTTFEGVKSPEQMKQQANQQQSSGGGISGALARRMMGSKGQTQQRTLILTTMHETLAIESAASEADVALPAGLKEKK